MITISTNKATDTIIRLTGGTFTPPQPVAMPPILPTATQRPVVGFNQYQVPITLQISSGLSLNLPVDPLVSISLANTVVCRNVAKGNIQGTIKEKWNSADYDITIAGVIGSDFIKSVADYVQDLLTIAQADESVKIISPYINDIYNITRIAITDIDLPFTQGEDFQQFTIKGKSDESYILETE